MKRLLLMIMVVIAILAGCGQDSDMDELAERQKEKVAMLKEEIAELEKVEERLDKELTDIKVDNGTAKYIMTLEIKQSHYLDIGKMLKDEINAIEIQIPVDKEYYDSLEVGDTIDDSFRLGSLLLSGSIGSWNIKVVDKEIK